MRCNKVNQKWKHSVPDPGSAWYRHIPLVPSSSSSSSSSPYDPTYQLHGTGRYRYRTTSSGKKLCFLLHLWRTQLLCSITYNKISAIKYPYMLGNHLLSKFRKQKSGKAWFGTIMHDGAHRQDLWYSFVYECIATPRYKFSHIGMVYPFK